MCHSEADQELWESDPHEYISQKFGILYIKTILIQLFNHIEEQKIKLTLF